MDRVSQREAAAADNERMLAALASIGSHARVANRSRVEQIDTALDQLESGTLTDPGREEAVRSAHQLAGSAGTFGLRPASRLASLLEQFFSALDIPVGQTASRAGLNGDLGAARDQLSELRSRLDDPPDLS